MASPLQSVLRYWHLLSLDAPTVAALWCWAFGRAARQHLSPWLPGALALGTWLFYVVDRLLDARLARSAELRERHRFHSRHRRMFLAGAAPVVVGMLLLIARMPHTLLESYMVLGGLCLLYLAVVHLPRSHSGAPRTHFPKELAVALLFAAAAALPAWDQARRIAAGAPRPHPLLVLCPLFAALCWLNCTAIERWEHQRTGGHIRITALLIGAGACISLLHLVSQAAQWLALCAALSAALFLLLDHSTLRAGGRRIAADLVLLTPLLLLL